MAHAPKRSFEDRLSKYSVMSAAALAAAIAAPAAQASVIISTPPDGSITNPKGRRVYVTMEGTAEVAWSYDPPPNAEFAFRHSGMSGSQSGVPFYHAAAQLIAVKPGASFLVAPVGMGTYSSVARLGPGTMIGPGGNFAVFWQTMASDLSDPPNGNWNSGGRDYVGVTFLIGNSRYYGWIEISIDTSYSYKTTIYRWAYEDQPGQAIMTPLADAGTVPEPGSAWLMALGAAGLVFYRKRKAAQAQ